VHSEVRYRSDNRVRPSELIELNNAHEQTVSYVQAVPRANYVNPFVPADTGDSYRYSEPRKADRMSIVRWSEPPATVPNPRQAIHTLIAQTPDLFVSDESAYCYHGKTDRPGTPIGTDIRERRTLEFDSAVEVYEEETPQPRAKNDETNTKRSSRNSNRSESRTKPETNSRANSAQRSSQS